jgi:hypothetical protein
MPTFALGILAAGVGLAILLGIIITARRREGAKKAPPAHNFKVLAHYTWSIDSTP